LFVFCLFVCLFLLVQAMNPEFASELRGQTREASSILGRMARPDGDSIVETNYATFRYPVCGDGAGIHGAAGGGAAGVGGSRGGNGVIGGGSSDGGAAVASTKDGCGGLLKPHVVFFGENLPPDRSALSVELAANADVLVSGTQDGCC